MEFHSELNPQLWNGTNLKEEVIEKLQEITEAFIEYLDIPSDAILDVRITGSSANYNYTPYSDLDLHLIVDYDKVHEDCPIVEGYLWSMKSAFNKEHDISIYGVPVEVYAEDSNNPAMSNGVYSLLNEEWIKMPEKIPPTDNDAAVDVKYNELKEAVEKMNDSEEAEELLDKIYKMRKAGLANGGEYSVENLAFKKLRNDGSIEKLKQIKKENIDKKLTLESYNKDFDGARYESYNNKQKFKVNDKVRKGKRIATIKKVDSPEKGYLDVEFEDGKDNGSYPKQYFRKITEALSTNTLKELVQKYPYYTVGTIKEMAKELEELTDIGCTLEIRESNSWHSCYTVLKKKDIDKWEHTYICDGELIDRQTRMVSTYDVAEDLKKEEGRVNRVTIKQETLESLNIKQLNKLFEELLR